MVSARPKSISRPGPRRARRAARPSHCGWHRLGGCAPQVGGADTFEKSGALAFEPIEPGGRPSAHHPLQRHGDGRIEQDRQIRPPRALDQRLELRDHCLVEATPCALIGIGRIGEAIAQDGPAGAQMRLDQVAEMHGPRGEHQQQFGQRTQGFLARLQHDVADRFRKRRSPGLPGDDVCDPARRELLGQRTDLGGFTDALDALEGHEAPRDHGDRRSRCRRSWVT
jgi:hypothetical protein